MANDARGFPWSYGANRNAGEHAFVDVSVNGCRGFDFRQNMFWNAEESEREKESNACLGFDRGGFSLAKLRVPLKASDIHQHRACK